MLCCESCRTPFEAGTIDQSGIWGHTWTHDGEERHLTLCDRCFHGPETSDDIWDRVQLRRWDQSKSERQWNSGDPITDEDRGIEPDAG